MAQQPWTVCFAGPGLVNETDVSAQLDNWWKDVPVETDFTIILPDRITRAQKGLGNVAAYVTRVFGDDERDDDGFITLPVNAMVDRLADAKDSGHEVALVLLWGRDGDDPCRNALEAAIEVGIPCKDLTAGLDNLTWEDEKPEVPPDEPESDAKARTQRRRHPSTPPSPEPSEDGTGPRRRGKPRAANLGQANEEQSTIKGKSAPQEPSPANDPTESVDMAFSEISLTAEKIGEIVYGEMKASWIRILTVMLESLKADGRKVGRPRTRDPEDDQSAFWTDGEGSYTKRGPGKPPRGQEVVWLTRRQQAELGLNQEAAE